MRLSIFKSAKRHITWNRRIRDRSKWCKNKKRRCLNSKAKWTNLSSKMKFFWKKTRRYSEKIRDSSKMKVLSHSPILIRLYKKLLKNKYKSFYITIIKLSPWMLSSLKPLTMSKLNSDEKRVYLLIVYS